MVVPRHNEAAINVVVVACVALITLCLAGALVLAWMHQQEAKQSALSAEPGSEHVGAGVQSPPRLSLALEKARYSESSKASTSSRTVVHRGAVSMDRAAPAGSKLVAAAGTQALRRRVNAAGAGPSSAAVGGVAASGSCKHLDAVTAARASNVGDCEHLSGSLYDTQETMDSTTVQEILGSVDAHHVHDTKLLLSACNWDMNELLMREMNNSYLN